MQKIKILDRFYAGVILNDGTISDEFLNELNNDGYLVLTDGETIELEDCETGELHTGKITITNDDQDFFLFDEYDENGKIVHEEQVSLFSYLMQLKECGALDAYPQVDF